ncbi:MAG: hypothetical protein U5J97_10285 [Trueperaceae bacterium]|nr:hypothetical protein [Trueperaceae bacterium]
MRATTFLPSEITIDLDSGLIERNDGGGDAFGNLSRFAGPKPYGYWTYSQPDTKYLDVTFTGGVARDTAILLTDPVVGEDAWTGKRSMALRRRRQRWCRRLEPGRRRNDPDRTRLAAARSRP